MSLSMLREREGGVITLLDTHINQGYAKRLRELGFREGERVTCLKILPFRGPRVFQVRDGVFSLDISTACRIFIRKAVP